MRYQDIKKNALKIGFKQFRRKENRFYTRNIIIIIFCWKLCQKKKKHLAP